MVIGPVSRHDDLGHRLSPFARFRSAELQGWFHPE
jgi:hypothetical protein